MHPSVSQLFDALNQPLKPFFTPILQQSLNHARPVIISFTPHMLLDSATHIFATRLIPILSSNSLDLTSAVSITFSGTFANLATFNP
jgi:hypothetical protein